MLRRRWLWLLPILQLLLFVSLIWIGCPYRPTWIAWINPPSAENAGQMSGMGTIRMEYIDAADGSLPEQVAQGLNVPAVLTGGFIAETIDYFREKQLTGAESELLAHVLAALLIPFLWYFVIKRLAVKNKNRSQASVPMKVIAIIGISILGLLALLVMFTFFISDTQPQIAAKILSLIWIVWGLYLLVLRIRKQSMVRCG